MTWDDLTYFDSEEYEIVQGRLNDLTTKGILYNPAPRDMLRAFQLSPYDKTKVIIVGQDPYPNPSFATGVAFDVPENIPVERFPPTLVNIFKEYSKDLGYERPASGSLRKWCEQGVLLWNCIPTCTSWISLSHDWPEYRPLTEEILNYQQLKETGVFVFLGGRARSYVHLIKDRSMSIETSHPSPLASKNSRYPFFGSRLFSSINAKLVEQGLEPIDWRL